MLNSWKCEKCGYTVKKDAPPKKCPSCNSTCTFIDNTCYTPECQFEEADNRIK